MGVGVGGAQGARALRTFLQSMFEAPLIWKNRPLFVT